MAGQVNAVANDDKVNILLVDDQAETRVLLETLEQKNRALAALNTADGFGRRVRIPFLSCAFSLALSCSFSCS